MKLLLFDIDGTLIDTGGSGMFSLTAAARSTFGSEGPPLDLAGSTDEGIVRSLFHHFDQEFTREKAQDFYRDYLVHLNRNLKSEQYPGMLLPGVRKLLEALATHPKEFALGLLTGNIAEGGWRKVRAYGIDQFFPFGAWGDDHWDRNKLGPIALERAANHHGHTFNPSNTWIIGDTPKDIACAQAIGAKCLAVETGRFTQDTLPGATTVCPDLTDTDSVLQTLRTI